MLAFRASSSSSSTKPPVNRSPASSSVCTCHWPTVDEFPLDVWSLHRFFSCSSSSPLPANDSSKPLACCCSPIRFDETDTDTETDNDDSPDITAFDLPASPAAADLSLATYRTRRIPSSSLLVFRQHRLRALSVSAHPPRQAQQLDDNAFGLNRDLNPDFALTHVSVRRTSPYLPSAVVFAAVPTTCFRRILYCPDLLPPTRPP
jgi:hypothetical protein